MLQFKFSLLLQRCALLTVLIFWFVKVSVTLPTWPTPYNVPVDYCKINDEKETLCQKCAKMTKSNIVYPMCCEEREEATTWCRKYLGFGIQEDYS